MSNQRFGADLIALAGDSSRAGRAALLDMIVDVLASLDTSSAEAHGEVLSDIVAAVAMQVEVRSREDFANRVADLPLLPRQVALVLARDAIEVARPILVRSTSLTDTDLVGLINTMSDAHLSAIALRAAISDVVCDALVSKGSGETLELLAANKGAKLSKQAINQLVDRARKQTRLASILARRVDLEPEVVKALYDTVESGLRALLAHRIMAPSGAPTSPRSLVYLSSGDDSKRIMVEVKQRKVNGRLPATELVRFLREDKPKHFCLALSEILDVDAEALADVLDRKDEEMLAALCKSAGVDRAVYSSICVLAFRGGDFARQLAPVAARYDALSAERCTMLRSALRNGGFDDFNPASPVDPPAGRSAGGL